MKESCYLVTCEWNPDLVWFVLSDSTLHALVKVEPLTSRIGILPRSLRCQEWSDCSLEGLIKSGAWQGLDPHDKIEVLVSTMKDITKRLSRMADSLDLEVYCQSIEKGLV